MKCGWMCLLAVCLTGAVASCSDGDDELDAPIVKPTPEEEVKKPELVVSGELDRVVPTAGKTLEIVFKATDKWTAKTDQTWCKLSAQSGSAGDRVVVNATLEASEEYDRRVAVVTVQMGQLKQQVKVTQMQKNALIVAKNEYVMTDEAGVLELEVQANVDYTVKTADGWLKQVQKSRALEKKMLKFELEANQGYDARESTITVEGGNLKQTVKVVQAQKDAIVAAKQQYDVNADEQVLEFKVSANVEFSVQTEAEWIVEEQTARGLVESNQRFRISANPKTESREGSIVFTSGKLKQTVKVVQEAPEVKPTPQPIPIFRLVVKFEGYTFHVPTFTGTDVLGVIRWGDGQEEAYQQDLKHSFAQEGLHEVTFDMKQTQQVEVKSLKGISHLSFIETSEVPEAETAKREK